MNKRQRELIRIAVSYANANMESLLESLADDPVGHMDDLEYDAYSFGGEQIDEPTEEEFEQIMFELQD